MGAMLLEDARYGRSSKFPSNGLVTLTNFYPKKNELFSKLVLEITTKCVLNHLLRSCSNGGCADLKD